MNLRATLLLLASITVPLASQTPPAPSGATDAHAQKLADIRKMLALTGGDKAANELFEVMMTNFRNSAPGNDEYLDELKKELGEGKIMDLMVGIYDKYLQTEDVKGIIQFYESPAGKKMIETTPRIVADSISEANAISRRVMERVDAKKDK